MDVCAPVMWWAYAGRRTSNRLCHQCRRTMFIDIVVIELYDGECGNALCEESRNIIGIKTATFGKHFMPICIADIVAGNTSQRMVCGENHLLHSV